METKKAWCVKTHIVSDYKTIVDENKMFRCREDAEKLFNNIVKKKREIAINKNFVFERDDNRNFRAFEEDKYEHNHIVVALMYLEHLSNKTQINFEK